MLFCLYTFDYLLIIPEFRLPLLGNMSSAICTTTTVLD